MRFFIPAIFAFASFISPPSSAEQPPEGQTNAAAIQALTLTGEFTQGGMVIGKAPTGARLALNDKDVAIADSGEFVLGFGRDEALEHQLKLTVPDGSRHNYSIQITSREYNIQRIEGIPKKIMSPSKKNLERIRKETHLVNEARRAFSQRLDFLPGFDWPLKGPITGVYGSQRFYNGEPRRPHFGLDIAAPVGTPVVAPADGVVTLAHQDMFYSGGTLIIDHGMGISSTFIHLSKVLVETGTQIKRGDKVALVGSKGRSTGPHLDWRLNWFQVRLDPALVMKGKPQ